MRLRDLQNRSLDELEQLYRGERRAAAPRGCFRGIFLRHLENRGTRILANQLIVRLGFEYTPFGVDFDDNRWFFFDRRLLIGHFRPVEQRSRWREADVVALHYEISRLPTLVRDMLYDEVKPLGPDLCLGLGGVNAECGLGDLFFFALERLER
ncbi:MAG: hypothetical protein KC609_00860 [Myxococcales bacterium]|nr:hypothetical protein [Myxococcales bacterium]